MANLKDTSIVGFLHIKSSENSKTGVQFNRVNEDANDSNAYFSPIAVNFGTQSKDNVNLGRPGKPFNYMYGRELNLRLGSNDYERFFKAFDDEKEKKGKVIIGNSINNSESSLGRSGRIKIYGTNTKGTWIRPADTTEDITLTLPSKEGTLCLTNHSHAFSTANFDYYVINKDKEIKTITSSGGSATGAIFEVGESGITGSSLGKVVIDNCYGWGSDFLDIFTIRGRFVITPNQDIDPNTIIRICGIRAKKSNILPGGITPLAIYTAKNMNIRAFIRGAVEDGSDTNGYQERSRIDIRCNSKLSKDSVYTFYFSGTYGKIGKNLTEKEEKELDAD